MKKKEQDEEKAEIFGVKKKILGVKQKRKSLVVKTAQCQQHRMLQKSGCTL